MSDLYRDGLDLLLATPEGRRYMLSLTVEAEEGDEAGLFDLMADAVADTDLRHMLQTHKADEERHASLFRGCLERNGWTKMDLPHGIGVLDHIGGGQGIGSVDCDEMIVLFASILHAIEKRGVERFPLIADAFEPRDAETAGVYRAVARDERGHVRYCERLGRRFAADEDAWNTALEDARIIEADAFEKAQAVAAEYVLAQGWLASV